MVVSPARSMPNASSITLETGATQFVVHDAFETSDSLVCALSFTPFTTVATPSPLAGAERITFLAPAFL